MWGARVGPLRRYISTAQAAPSGRSILSTELRNVHELQLEIYIPRWWLAYDHEVMHPAADIESNGQDHPDSEDEPTHDASD
jgi:hypothetical protein